jgi:hydrogenase maturation protease
MIMFEVPIMTDQRPRDDLAEASLMDRPVSFVVIGYGNELRGDDAVGPYVARVVRSWMLPDVEVFAVHQLTPELAEVVAGADAAIFIDACVPTDTCHSISIRAIEPLDLPFASAHSGDPQMLLALADALYRHCPQAWWITIPATQFEFGADLSSVTWTGATAALQWIRASIRRAGQCMKLD